MWKKVEKFSQLYLFINRIKGIFPSNTYYSHSNKNHQSFSVLKSENKLNLNLSVKTGHTHLQFVVRHSRRVGEPYVHIYNTFPRPG